MKLLLIKGINSLGFAIPILYEIFILIDSWIYAFASYAMQAFFHIAKLELDTNNLGDITYIMNRIMLLVGVYALFKLSITLINYIIDPNKIDAAGGKGIKIVQKIVIAFVLLASSNFIFDNLFKFQNAVIDSNVIPKIIYGSENYQEEDDGDMALTSRKFVNNVFMILFQNDADDGVFESAGALEAKKSVLQGESLLLISPYAYSTGFSYIPFVTGIVGILLAYYFITYAIELAVRIIKLFTLQILSPIPIIMNIDPSSKGDKLANFAKLYGGIYVNVFVRILTVYVAFVALNLISTVFSDLNWISKIVIIIGVFHATKELPKLIEDALGVKLGLGDAGKGFGAVLRSTIAGGAGLFGGAIAGGISGGAGGALAGAYTGLTSGIINGAKAKGISGVISSGVGAVKGGYGMGGKVLGAGGLGAFMVGGVENFFGGKGRDAATVADFDNQIKNKDKDIENVRKGISAKQQKISNSNANLNIQNQADNLRKNVEGLFARKSGFGTMDDFVNNNKDYIAAKELLSSVPQGTDQQDINYLRQNMENARLNAINQYNQARDSYYQNHFDGTKVDADLTEAINDYNAYCQENGLGADRMIKGYDSASGLINDANVSVETLNINDAKAIQSDIAKYQQEINAEELKIDGFEQDKKDIENNKKNFINKDKGYQRRNKRNEKPTYKSRNVNNDSDSAN